MNDRDRLPFGEQFSNGFAPHARVLELAGAACDGLMDARARDELESLVLNDAEACWLYVQYLDLHAALPRFEAASETVADACFTNGEPAPAMDDSGEASAASPAERAGAFDFTRRKLAFSLLAAAASVVIFLGILALVRHRVPDAESPAPLSPHDYVAHITKLYEAEWASGDETNDLHTPLEPGRRVRLEKGYAEITYRSGTKVLLQGKTDFVITSKNQGRLASGRMTAKVPPEAHGFRVDLSTFSVIDLGTEFGVLHDEHHRTEVHVFSGHVEIVPGENGNSPEAPQISRQKLSTGQGIVIKGIEGAVESQAADRTRFVLPWHPVLRGTRLIAFYPFDGDARDESLSSRHATYVEKVEFVPGKEGQAARFSLEGNSYIDLPIDAGKERMPQMTWGAWVRPRQLDEERAIQIMVSTDNNDYDRVLTLDRRTTPDAPLLEVTRFGAFAGHERGVVVDTTIEPAIDRWTFIAASYDEHAKTLSLYVERPEPDERGKLLAKTNYSNTNFNASHTVIRLGYQPFQIPHGQSFRGDMDNFFVIRGVLSHEELEQIAAGKGEVLRAYNPRRNIEATKQP